MKTTRKILSLLLCAALLLCGLTLTAAAITAGDVNGDGNVTSADARLALRASVQLEQYEPGSAAFLAADVIAAIDAAVEEGADVLVLPGFMFAPAIQQTAGKYPDVKFIAVDVSADDFEEGLELPANLYCAVYQEELCGYMAGFAAVKLGYTKLGFLGGMAVPSVVRYGNGFVQGADAAAAELGLTDVTVRYGYAGQFYPDDELTEAMKDWYGSGTQIVFACGGGIYGSVAGAAKETDGAKLIGVDVDQAEQIAQAAARGDGDEAAYMDLTVTSAVKNHGATVALALKAVFTGKFGEFGGKSDRLGVISADPEENAVQLAASTQFGKGFTVEDYAALTARIFNGELSVDDDADKAPAGFATVIAVDDVGNVK